jgi:dynein heavy chain 1
LNDLENKWDLEIIKKASNAVGYMASWVEAIFSFSEIVNNVQPLTDEIHTLKGKRNQVEKEYEVVINDINKLEKNIAQLKVNYEQSVFESNAIKKDMEEFKSKVERSERLFENLSSEKTR